LEYKGSLTSVEARQNLSCVVPAEMADIFGHPPVLSTENRQAYDAMMTQLVLEWKPQNIIGSMFVRDITDISWEIFRHRRLKPSDACCPTCASSTGTTAALLRSATEQFAVFRRNHGNNL
jgi:hypothetical protein